ncbi:MAG: hypothetical protein HQL83_12245 [Magnetococcales bacterium]|nr:hypothetical protein [Magnetococcales bacterium]
MIEYFTWIWQNLFIIILSIYFAKRYDALHAAKKKDVDLASDLEKEVIVQDCIETYYNFLLRYRVKLKIGLDFLDSFFGKKILDNFLIHNTLAFIYCVIFFQVSWYLTNNSIFEGVDFLSKPQYLVNAKYFFSSLIFFKVWTFLQIAFYSTVTFMIYLGVYIIYHDHLHLDYFGDNHQADSRAGIFGGIIAATVTLCSINSIPAATSVIVGVLASRIYLQMKKKKDAVSSAFRRAGTNAIVISLVLILIGALLFESISKDSLTAMLMFWVILPIVNSICDLFSLLASRYFGEKIYTNTSFFNIVRWGTIDAIVGLVILIFFVILLVLSVKFTNYIIILLGKGTLIALSVESISTILSDPFNGAWIILMIFTTFIPTALHMAVSFAGVAAVFIDSRVSKYVANSRKEVINNASTLAHCLVIREKSFPISLLFITVMFYYTIGFIIPKVAFLLGVVAKWTISLVL